MIPTTPNQDRYTRFSCPNPDCLQDIGPVLSPLSIAPGQASRSNGCGVPSVGARSRSEQRPLQQTSPGQRQPSFRRSLEVLVIVPQDYR